MSVASIFLDLGFGLWGLGVTIFVFEVWPYRHILPLVCFFIMVEIQISQHSRPSVLVSGLTVWPLGSLSPKPCFKP